MSKAPEHKQHDAIVQDKQGKQDKANMDRRGFFRSLGGSAAAAAAVAGVPLASAPALATENQNERTKSRYKESDHVKAFYRTNRY